jgi:hypothetical protein
MSQVSVHHKIAKRGLLWEWYASQWIGGPLSPWAKVWPRSRFYYRNHGFTFSRQAAVKAAWRSDRRQRAWMDRWETA